MAKPLKPDKIEDMFELYRQGQSVESLAKICRVSPTTVWRYKKLGKWDERKANLLAKAQNKLDETRAKRLARQANLGKMLQSAGSKVFLDDKGKVKDEAIKSARDGITAIAEGIKIEREVLGDAEVKGDTNIQINVQFVMPDAPPPKVRGVESEVVE